MHLLLIFHRTIKNLTWGRIVARSNFDVAAQPPRLRKIFRIKTRTPYTESHQEDCIAMKPFASVLLTLLVSRLPQILFHLIFSSFWLLAMLKKSKITAWP
jgi:hypothetical protein